MEALAARLQQIDLTPLLVLLIDQVNAEALPHLAAQFGVTGYDGWLLCTTDDERRALIKKAFQLHRYKGTPWAVKEVIKAVGYADVEVQEHFPTRRHDGSYNHDRSDYYGSPVGQWALFRVMVDLGEDKGLTATAADLIKGGINAYKNARSWLQHHGFRSRLTDQVPVAEGFTLRIRQTSISDSLLYTGRYDGTLRHDGSLAHDDRTDKATLTIRYRTLHNGLRTHNASTLYGATLLEVA